MIIILIKRKIYKYDFAESMALLEIVRRGDCKITRTIRGRPWGRLRVRIFQQHVAGPWS